MMHCQTVVVVERDALVRDTLTELLKEEGYVTHGAEDAAQARAILAQVPHPCLILADLLHAEAHCAGFLEQGTRDNIVVEIPIAVIESIDAAPSAISSSAARRVDAWLRRPYDHEQFLETVRRYCRSVQESAS